VRKELARVEERERGWRNKGLNLGKLTLTANFNEKSPLRRRGGRKKRKKKREKVGG